MDGTVERTRAGEVMGIRGLWTLSSKIVTVTSVLLLVIYKRRFGHFPYLNLLINLTFYTILIIILGAPSGHVETGGYSSLLFIE